MKKNTKKALIIIGVLLLIILNVCIGVTLINNDKKKEDTNNDIPQVGDGTPIVGSSSVKIVGDYIYIDNVRIKLDDAVVESSDERISPYKLENTHYNLNSFKTKEGYKILACFNMYSRREYSRVMQYFKIKGMSFKDIVLYRYDTFAGEEVPKHREGDNDVLYSIPKGGDFCFLVKNTESNSE